MSASWMRWSAIDPRIGRASTNACPLPCRRGWPRISPLNQAQAFHRPAIHDRHDLQLTTLRISLPRGWLSFFDSRMTSRPTISDATCFGDCLVSVARYSPRRSTTTSRRSPHFSICGYEMMLSPVEQRTHNLGETAVSCAWPLLLIEKKKGLAIRPNDLHRFECPTGNRNLRVRST